MTLDEAIKHAEEVAEKNEERASWFWAKEGNPSYDDCIKCAEEHRQLAEWLNDYKRLLEQEPFMNKPYVADMSRGQSFDSVIAEIREQQNDYMKAVRKDCGLYE